MLLWALSGPIFGFSNTWQLVINTATTIVTFLMVFLIQNTQNRDTEAMQLKLDELIRATQGAHNALLDLEDLEDDAARALPRRYEALAARAREAQARADRHRFARHQGLQDGLSTACQSACTAARCVATSVSGTRA